MLRQQDSKDAENRPGTGCDRDVISLVVGDAYPPGGTGLTRRLVERMGLLPGERVLNITGGRGGTALLLAREYWAEVDGVDRSLEGVVQARALAAAAAGLFGHVRIHCCDACMLPFGDSVFDVIVCECKFGPISDKAAAAAEFARVLRPGGRLGMTDITVTAESFDETLSRLIGRVTGLTDGCSFLEYSEILRAAGLRTTMTERCDDVLVAMVDRVEARLRAIRSARRSSAAVRSIDFVTALSMTEQVRRVIVAGKAGFGLLVAESSTTD